LPTLVDMTIMELQTSDKIRAVSPEVVETVRVTSMPSPLSMRRISVEVPTGGSIADMLAVIGLIPEAPARVFLGDRPITLEERSRVFPKPGEFLTVRVIPAGRGGKSALAIVVTIAVMAAAAWVSAGALAPAMAAAFGPAIGGSFAAGGFGALLAGSAVSVLGSLLLKALVPPPKPPTPKVSSTPHSFSVSGNANFAAPYSPIPKIYGARKIFPQYAASPYAELLGENQYLRMILLLGYGPLDISQIKIGDTAIENFEDVEWELRSGFLNDAPPRLYPGSVVEQDFSSVLSTTNANHTPTLAGFVLQTSGTNADELSVDIAFPGGLTALSKASGSTIHIQCTWQIQWRLTGTTTWTSEPDIVIKSTAKGTTRKGHVWRVPRGQYDVQMQLFRFTIAGADWTNPYTADAQWTALRTIRAQPPYAMGGLALLGLRIRASRQLNGVIDNLNCVASSILPDYNSVTGLWNDRAGAWTYDYDNAGAGASLYSLDATNVHSTNAVTDKRFMTDFVIGTANGTQPSYSATLPVSTPNTIQLGSLIISCGTKASATSARGTKKKSAAVAALPFITDDGQGNIVGFAAASWTGEVFATGNGSTTNFSHTMAHLPVLVRSIKITAGSVTATDDGSGNLVGTGISSGSINYSTGVASITFTSAPGNGVSITVNYTQSVAAGTINYATGALAIVFSTAPAVGDDPVADFTLLIVTPGAGRALAIAAASSADQAAVASKSIGVKILPPDGSTGTPAPTKYTVSGWYRASSALSTCIRIRVFWGGSEDFASTAAISSVDVISAGNATTSYQQALATVTAPSGATWMRVAVYHLGAGTGVTVFYDDLSVKPNEQGVTALEQLANPSFDFAGRITSNPASHFRDALQGRANKLAIGDLRLDLNGLKNWWTDNNTNNRNFNSVLDSPSTVFDSLQLIASFGRASFTMRDSLYSVVEDKTQLTPIQHFTPRNSWGFKWSKGFPNIPQALKVRYINPANNWQNDERVVYDDKPGGVSYENIVISMTPLLYYQMGELSGTTGVDSMGLNNGTYAGSLTLGQAGLLNTDATPSVLINSGGHLNPANIPAVRLNTMSGVFWARQTGTISSFGRYAEFDGESVSSPGWALQNDGGTGLGLRLDTSAGVNQVLSFPGHVGDGNVHMIAFAADSGGTMYVSLDGAPWTTTSYAVGTGLAQIATVPFQIGAGQTNFKIAHFAYWNRVLANSELANLYAKGAISIAAQYDPSSTSLYEVLDLTTGCTDYVQAWRDARFHLAQGRLRGETYEWFADVENIVCQHGDLVYLTHDVPEFGLGSGRIKSVQLDGSSNCTGITTDEQFSFDFGATYVVRVRRTADGTSLLQTLTNPASALGATVNSTTSGAWAAARLAILGKDGPPVFRSSALGPNGTATSAIVTMPSGTHSGDLLVVQLGFTGNPGTITPPTGWGLRRQDNDAGNTTYQALLYKVANASEPGSYTFSWVSSVAYFSGAVAFSNVADDEPIEIDAGYGFASATSASPPVVAPAVPSNDLIVVLAQQNSSGTLSLSSTTQLWAPATGLGAWYYPPSSLATGVLTFQTPIPLPATQQPGPGDLVMFGLQGSETNQVLITKIEPSQDLSARLTAVDYAPAVYSADAVTPTFNSQGAAAPTRPVPTILSVNSTDLFSVRAPDGSIEARIMLSLTPIPTMLPDAGAIVGIEYHLQTSSTQGTNNLGAYSSTTPYNTSDMVTYGGQNWVAIVQGLLGVTPGTDGSKWTLLDESSPWTEPAEVPATSLVIIAGVESHISYNIQLRYVFVDGSRSDWSSVTHVVAGQTTLPPDVTGLTAANNLLGKVTLNWLPATMPNVREYEIRLGSSWPSAVPALDRVRKTMWKSDPLPAGSYTFWVGVIDTSGNYSSNSPASVSITITSTAVVNSKVDTPGINPNAVTNTPITDVASQAILGLPAWAANTAKANGTQIADGAGDAQQVIDQKVNEVNLTSPAIANSLGIAVDDYPFLLPAATPNPSGVSIAAIRQWVSCTVAFKTAVLGIPPSRVAAMSAGAGGAGTSISVTKSGSVVNGNLLVAFVAMDLRTAVASLAGWTVLATFTNATEGAVTVLYKIASSEPASWSFGLSASTRAAAAVLAYSGAQAVVDASASASGNSTAITIPTVTTGAYADEIVTCYAWFNGATATAISLTDNASQTGGAAPTWNTTLNGPTQDNYLLWQNVGTGVGYNTWLTLATIAITVLASSDPLDFVVEMDQTGTNVQPNDEADLQILDAPNYPSLSGSSVVDAHMPARAVVTAQSGLASSGEGSPPTYHKKLTGFSAGPHTFVLQEKLVNGFGTGIFKATVNNCHFDITDIRR
jgi:predicted phage tail protein